MRTFLICVALLVLAFIGYAYSKNPAGCMKVVRDVGDVLTSISPVSVELKPTTPTAAPAPEAPSDSAESSNAAPVTPPTTPPAPSPVALVPAPPPLKKWSPPSPFPAQPNWTWTTLSGKTYQNVVITDMKPDEVSITHSLGAATIAMVLLPPDLQKQLDYDPEAAAAAKAESDREEAHPYYALAAKDAAQQVARQLHWPVAWMCTDPACLTAVNPPLGSCEDLSQLALNRLKTQAVVILISGNEELVTLPPVILNDQFFQFDDGPVPGGHHFYPPKIVFSDADLTKSFGRVSFTQLKASREGAIDTVLDSIANDPAAQALLNGQPEVAPAPSTNAPPTVSDSTQK